MSCAYPKRKRQLLFASLSSDLQMPNIGVDETGSVTPGDHFLVCESESSMSVVGSQELQRVGRKVGDEQASAWTQGAGGLSNRCPRIVKKMQYVVNGHHVHRPGGHGKIVDVTVTYLAMLEVDPGAAVAEAARTLRPGGRLLIADFAPRSVCD